MTLGKIFYYILFIPTLLAKGIYYVFHAIDFFMDIGMDFIEVLMEEIKDF
jgi:hypothetical protein